MKKRIFVLIILAATVFVLVFPAFAEDELPIESETPIESVEDEEPTSIENETAAPIESETITPTESETLTPTENETSAPIESETPEAAESEEPTPIESEEPETIETEAPAPVESETPAPVETEEPTPVETEAPAPTESETPVESEEPTSIESEEPEPVESETPASVETEEPTPVETEEPTPVETEATTPTETEAPAPVESETPTPTEREEPTPAESEISDKPSEVDNEVDKAVDDTEKMSFGEFLKKLWDDNKAVIFSILSAVASAAIAFLIKLALVPLLTKWKNALVKLQQDANESTSEVIKKNEEAISRVESATEKLGKHDDLIQELQEIIQNEHKEARVESDAVFFAMRTQATMLMSIIESSNMPQSRKDDFYESYKKQLAEMDKIKAGYGDETPKGV